jgi:hypothetical protein
MLNAASNGPVQHPNDLARSRQGIPMPHTWLESSIIDLSEYYMTQRYKGNPLCRAERRNIGLRRKYPMKM